VRCDFLDENFLSQEGTRARTSEKSERARACQLALSNSAA
jgi:hypothetical protein